MCLTSQKESSSRGSIQFSLQEGTGRWREQRRGYSQTMCSVALMRNVFKVGIQIRLTNNQHIMNYMRSPLTGHLFLLFRGSLSQRGERRLVPAAQIHLCGGHEGQVLHLAAQLRLLFAQEQAVRTRPDRNILLRGLLTAQLSLVWRTRLHFRLWGAELCTFTPRFLSFCISKARLPACRKRKAQQFVKKQ